MHFHPRLCLLPRCPQGHVLTAARMGAQRPASSLLAAEELAPRGVQHRTSTAPGLRSPGSSSFLPRVLCGSATLPCTTSTGMFWGCMGTFTIREILGDPRLGPSWSQPSQSLSFTCKKG